MAGQNALLGSIPRIPGPLRNSPYTDKEESLDHNDSRSQRRNLLYPHYESSLQDIHPQTVSTPAKADPKKQKDLQLSEIRRETI